MKTKEQQAAWDEVLLLSFQNPGWDEYSEIGLRIQSLMAIVENREFIPRKKGTGRKLTAEEKIEIKVLYLSGVPKSRLREIYHVTWGRIADALIETGAIEEKINRDNQQVERVKDEIVEKYLDGVPFSDLTKKYGQTKVYDTLHERKVKRWVPRNGEDYF